MTMTVNYIVYITYWHGSRQIECEAEDQAWDAIGSRMFGGLYSVVSPTGLDTDQLIPF